MRVLITAPRAMHVMWQRYSVTLCILVCVYESHWSQSVFLLQADKRAHHNALERKRRDHIKDSFHGLRDSVPALQGEKVSVSVWIWIWRTGGSLDLNPPHKKSLSVGVLSYLFSDFPKWSFALAAQASM